MGQRCSSIEAQGLEGGGVARENPVGLSMCDGPIKTVKYISMNI